MTTTPAVTLFARRWQMLPIVLFGAFLGMFDRFVVIVATPAIQRDLSAGRIAVELIVAGYGFCYASGLVTGGRLGDLFGFRRMFILGMAGFAGTSALCGVAQTSGQLVAARLAQGVTAAVMIPQVLALITATFPQPERHRAMSWFGVTIGVSSVAGQVLGGLMVQADVFGLGWRMIFLVNVPLAATAAVAARWLLPDRIPCRRQGLDPIGTLGVPACLALALVPLVFGRTYDWPAWVWQCAAASVVGLAVLLWWEAGLARRGGSPVVDLTLFRNVAFRAGLAINIAFMVFFGGLLLAVSVVLQDGMALSPLETGLAFLPLGVSLAVTSIVARRLASRWGPALIASGGTVTALGLLSLLAEIQVGPSAFTPTMLALPMTLIGLGQGLAYPVVIGVTLAGIPQHQAGAASGVLTTAQQFAGAIGVAMLDVLFFHGTAMTGPVGHLAALTPVVVFDLVLVGSVIGLTRLLPRVRLPVL
jgi:MFS family permease